MPVKSFISIIALLFESAKLLNMDPSNHTTTNTTNIQGSTKEQVLIGAVAGSVGLGVAMAAAKRYGHNQGIEAIKNDVRALAIGAQTFKNYITGTKSNAPDQTVTNPRILEEQPMPDITKSQDVNPAAARNNAGYRR
jgi:hypothetical protein